MLRITNILKASIEKNWKTMLMVFAGLVLFAWFISIALAPLNKMRELQTLASDPLFTESFDTDYTDPGMSILAKEKAYKEALLELAQNDSIQLVINLSDSTVFLSIKAVMIHQTKVNEFSMDRLLGKMSTMQEYRLISKPLEVHSSYASIVKEPVVVRHAPKDPLEAELNAWQPDTLIQFPAFTAFSLDHNFLVIFEQDENKSFYDHWKKFGFYNHLRFKKTISSMGNFLGLKKQDYQPVITIKMPVDDLRAIYRALPNKTFIVLKP